MHRVFHAALVAIFLSGLPGQAQTANDGSAVLDLPAGARALGLGLAFQADGSDSDAVFVSPALASEAGGVATGIVLLSKQARAYSVSAATEWFGGGVAVGLRALEYGADPLRAGERSLDVLRDGGEVGVSEMALSLAYGRDVWGGVRLGLTGKLVDRRVDAAREQDVALDVGLAHRLGPGRLHLTVRSDGNEDRPYDATTVGWGGYGQRLGPLDLGAAVAVTHRDDEEWIVGGGLEVGYWPIVGRNFIGRIGVRSIPEGEAWPVTFGGSFEGDRIVLDYAFQGFDDRTGSHQITIAWR